MKRLTALLLALTVLLTTLAGCQSQETPSPSERESSASSEVVSSESEATPEPEPASQIETIMAGELPYDEYKRGIWYGFLPEELDGANPNTTTLTWAQFCDMLGRMIARYKPEQLATWEEMTKDAPDTDILPDGADLAITFACETIDLLEVNGDWWDDNYTGWSTDLHWDHPIFDWEKPLAISEEWQGDDHILLSAQFVRRRRSCVNGMALDELTETDTRNGEDPLLLRRGMEAVVRLYESDEDVGYAYAEKMLDQVLQTPEAQEIVAKAEARKAAILSSPTEIVKSDTFIQGETYTGTAYYISNNGDDANDGLSPETAWATLDNLATAPLQFGDAIFFERGSTWRKAQIPNHLCSTEGITLSAYGEGEKPFLTGSPENGAGAEKWELYYQDGEKKIWKFYAPMSDVGAVVLDGGETYAKRAMAYWHKATRQYYSFYDITKPYDIQTELPDMQVFPDLRYPEDGPDPLSIYVASYSQNGDVIPVTGDFYFRCDKGNPGEVFTQIEFISGYVIQGGTEDYSTYDNLHLGYCISTIAGGSANGDSQDHIYFQNMEVEWMGGGIKRYSEEPSENMDECFFSDGGGLNTNGSFETLRNNYTHHCFQEGFSIETFDDDPDLCEENLLEGNISEYCQMAAGVINWDQERKDPHTFHNIAYRDNIVLFSGFENFYNLVIRHQGLEHNNGGRRGWLTDNTNATSLFYNAHDGTVSYENNLFAFSAFQLILDWRYTEEYHKIFHGNTYAQLPGVTWLQKTDWVEPGTPGIPTQYINDPEVMANLLGDDTAAIIRFDEPDVEDEYPEPAEASVVEPTPEPTPEPTRSPMPAEEYERGVWRGFLPEELEGADPDATNLTWKQFDEMLGRMIGKYRPEKAEEWAELTQDAPDRELKRDGAAMALLYAAELVDLLGVRAEPFETPNSFFYSPSLDYGGFDVTKPISVDGPRGWINSDNLGGGRIEPAMLFAVLHDSQVTNKPLMEIPEDGMFHAWGSVSLRDGMISVVRLLESDGAVADNAKEQLGQS